MITAEAELVAWTWHVTLCCMRSRSWPKFVFGFHYGSTFV